MKKKSIIIAFALSTVSVFGQEIKLRESNENFSNGSHNALSVNLYVSDIRLVEKEWKSQMKDFGYDKSSERNDEYFFDNVLIKALGNNTLDVFSKVTPIKGEKAVRLFEFIRAQR